MEHNKLKLYYNPKYFVQETEQACFVTYIYQHGLYLTTESTTEKLLQKNTFELNNDTIDSYVASRGFDKVLEFDKDTIEWFNGYDDTEKRAYIKSKILSIKNTIKNKSFSAILPNRTFTTMYVHLNILYGAL